jgi:hypothetical protein
MTTYRLRRDSLTWLEADDEVVALDEDKAAYLSANASATVLWVALADGAARDDLVERLVQSFGISADVAGADVDAFLADLQSRNLIEAV